MDYSFLGDKKKIDRIVRRLNAIIADLQNDPREYMKQLAKNRNPKFNPKHEKYFAKKEEIDPKKIELEIELVNDKKTSEIFKSAMSLWNVPISVGYGRRMRFILWDKTHNKVFGIFGLCDPIIGLKVRDEYIGWDERRREKMLYNIMSAYILGAVYPYNELYGSKMTALSIGSKEVCKLFEEKYKDRESIIKKRVYTSKLVAVDTMAFFGKSLIYEGLKEWQFLGYTKGQSYVHLDELWGEIMELTKSLKIEDSEKYKLEYGANWRFKAGHSWKFKIWRIISSSLGIPKEYLFTGITKGYYFRPLIENWREFLKGETDDVIYANKSFDEYFEIWKGKYLRKRIRKFGNNSNTSNKMLIASY
jgi:hypothetical protein